jgi:hypothetical protein
MLRAVRLDVTIAVLGAGRETGSQSRHAGNQNGKQKRPGAHDVLLKARTGINSGRQEYDSPTVR